ncbi:protein translocase subunit SecD [Alkalibaculum sp. M08DMB]|uniref:Protein translocase subunit SecD n=1 Tax=Alkalibaculum sporogenes TaxID=2655001 RepID=A0A6A7K5C5_9FIRM|nr:protein translocase subunit SecD [Alkalibaculum sporogenes]MPW24561.1 protein translocase subunit SecD [Alkalibaculum sporogenes]
MKLKNALIFCMVLTLIFASGLVMFNGLSIGKYEVVPISEAINYGLDLTGGVYVVLEAQDSPDDPVTDEKIDRAIATIRERIDNLGVSEPIIARQGNDRIRVSIPNIQDQSEALQLIGKTAQLEFVDPNGEIVLTGAHVDQSNAVYQTDDFNRQTAVVTLKLNQEGSDAFAEATKEFINQVIEIRLDNEVISAPNVQTEITDGEAVITGMANLEEAGNLAMLIRAGALPVQLEPIEITTVGPSLGQDSLDKSILGGIIGISLVLAFILLYYRVPGLIACLALIIYILLNFLVFTLIGVTITLPGIAGIILSVGMAVDANVIIFERIKEELKLGKSLMASIDAGFKRAITAIIDGNITTIIAGVVLFALGSGTVRGFAVTLMIGVVISMFTSLTITKRLLKLFASTQFIKNNKFYGA